MNTHDTAGAEPTTDKTQSLADRVHDVRDDLFTTMAVVAHIRRTADPDTQWQLHRAAGVAVAQLDAACSVLERISLDAMVLLAVGGLERVATVGGNSFSIAEGPDLNSKDCELILRALDALDRLMQAELANKGQDAAASATWSRVLITRAKVQAMAGAS